MSSRKTLTFMIAMSLSAAGLTATTSRAGWIHATASTCKPLQNASLTTGGAPPSLPDGGVNNGPGLYQQESEGVSALQVVCPVVDTSAAQLSDVSLFSNIAPVVFLPFITQATGQACTAFIVATGGSCGAAVNSATTSGKTNWAVPTTNWTSNPSDYHWLFVSIPTHVSGSPSQFYGYSVYL